MKRFVFFFKFCCSIQNKPWPSQSAEEIKPITVICPLEDENLKILTLELVPSHLSKKGANVKGQITVIGFISSAD